MANPETTHTVEWNGGNRPAAPSVQHTRGYDAKTTAIQATNTGYNAWLTDSADNTHVKLTLTAIDVDLALSGSTGQSVLTRDFYARNFQQPSFSITCQARSQADVGYVSEFVHKAQRNALTRGSLMGLIIPRGGLKNTQAGMRGVRQGMSAAGYVRNMPRAHRRHDPAPLFTFQFVIARMRAGLWEDQPYKVYQLAKWSDIVETVLKGNFISAPQAVEDEAEAESLRGAIDAINNSIDFLGDLFG